MSFFRLITVFIFVASLAGCAAGYEKFHGDVSAYMAGGDCASLAAYIVDGEKDGGFEGSNESLLFLLDSATALMGCGDFKASNRYFHKADILAEKLWTKSIGKEAASFLLSDYTRPYAGEDFERAFINLFSAINYVMLGEIDEALVEVRRLDSLLSMYNREYEEKNVYREDAFGRYLGGIIYDATGAVDDAFIDYRKAYATYGDYEAAYGTKMPVYMVEDYLRVAERAGRIDEVGAALKRFAGVEWKKQAETRGLGRVVFIHLAGKAPEKVSDKIIIGTKHGPVSLAFPKFVAAPVGCRRSRLYLESGRRRYESETELVEDIGAIAVKNLSDRRGRVIAKELARVVVKQVAMKSASDELGGSKKEKEAIRMLFNIVDTAVSRADTRSWRTLPGAIHLSRAFVPPGSYNASASFCGGERTSLGRYDIDSGETRFILYRSHE